MCSLWAAQYKNIFGTYVYTTKLILRHFLVRWAQAMINPHIFFVVKTGVAKSEKIF